MKQNNTGNNIKNRMCNNNTNAAYTESRNIIMCIMVCFKLTFKYLSGVNKTYTRVVYNK